MQNRKVNSGEQWPQELREAVVFSYLSGERLKDIGREHGISQGVIIQVKGRKWFREIRHNIIREGALSCGYKIPEKYMVRY